MVVDEKCGRKEKKEELQEIANGIKPILNPTIRLVVVNLCTKYGVSIFNGCGDIFDEKCVTELRKHGRTELQIDVNQIPPLFQSRDIMTIQFKERETETNRDRHTYRQTDRHLDFDKKSHDKHETE